MNKTADTGRTTNMQTASVHSGSDGRFYVMEGGRVVLMTRDSQHAWEYAGYLADSATLRQSESLAYGA